MAIVKMKKLRVMAMADQRDMLLQGLLHLGCVEISEPGGRLSDPAWAKLLQRENSGQLASTKTEITDVDTALAAIKKYAQMKDGLFIKRHPISEQEFLGSSTVDRAREVSRTIGGLLQTLTRLQNEESRLAAKRAALLPWESLDMPLEAEGTANAVFRMGVCPGGTDTGAIRAELAESAAELFEISADKQQVYYLLLCHRAEEQAVMEILRPHNFSVVTFQGTTGTAEENLRALDCQLTENRAAQEKATAEIVKNSEARDAIRVYADRLATEAARETNTERLMTNGTIVFFEGWAPAEKMKDVQALLEKHGCAWEASDPTEEEIPDVPVQLKNNWLTKPLNMVTEMYSLPRYDNVDPNPLMAPFFILFYGIMLADMGYGLLMILAGLFITKKYHPKGTMGHMFNLATLCGISTFVMGALTGGFFGDFIPQLAKLINPASTLELPALFTPLNDTLMILIGSMALGLVQIVTGMAISFIRKVKRGQYLDALFEEVTWWVVFAGIGCMALGVTNVVLYAGIVLVFAGPLITGKGFGKIMGIFGSLYNHITGYFGDILSYARLMALMLAGSVIAQVFNTLGAIPGNVIVFLLISMAGNALNFALNLLGCYVHDLRLQCLEYFGKFYEDGGKPFRPLAIQTKYVDIE